MNHDEKNPDTQAGIELELEARIVAWVAGEASAFEAAELERLTGERPELAIFKRRIQAVQGLVAEAVRPEKAPLRLAPERRANLLKAIGVTGAAEETPAAVASKVPWLWATRQLQARQRHWMLAVAACLVLGGFLFLQFIPSSRNGLVFERLEKAAADERQNHMVAMELPMSPAEAESRDGDSDQAPSVVDIPLLPPAPRPAAFGRVSASAAAAPKISMPPMAPPPSQPGWAAEEVKMSPFSVTASQDERGYAATSTLAGTRVQRNLPDLASSTPTEITLGYEGNFAGGNESRKKTSAQDWASKTGDFVQASNAPDASDSFGTKPSPAYDSIQFAARGGPADIKGKTYGRASDKEASRVLRFSGASAKKQGYFSEELLANVELKKELNGPATASEVTDKLETSKEDAGRKAREEDKPARPIARPAPPAEASVEISAAKEPVSTFSLHVSDASFRIAQAALARGEAPDPALIRPEEFYNAFDYGDPAPGASEKVACRIEQAAHPILQQRNLVRIAMKVPATGRGAGQPLRLTVLLDTSGSMEREDRAAAVHRALEVLVSLLGANDRLTLIGFARQPRLLAEEVPGDQASQVIDIASRTPAEGGTNIEEALKLAGELAGRHFEPQAQNRIVLLTDGAANLGNADPAQLAVAIETLRQQRIAFDACGVGTDGLDDAILEALTRKGDGRYYVLDTPESADAGFARQLAGAFRPAAENVKVQVRFNPARVGNYRLIGFEHHRLREEDFRNDKVDAAELAAEEAAVALYEVEALPQGEGELGEVYVRFRDAATRSMVERSWTMTYEPQVRSFDRASPTMQLAGTAALLAEKLRGGAMADQITLDELAPVASALRSRYGHEARVQQLVTMFEQMRRLGAK
jgi:hypothetical protein